MPFTGEAIGAQKVLFVSIAISKSDNNVSLALSRHVMQHSNPQPYGLVQVLDIKCNDTICRQREWVKQAKSGRHARASWRILRWGWPRLSCKTTSSIKLLTGLTDGTTRNLQISFNFSCWRHKKQAAISVWDGEEGGIEARHTFLHFLQHYCLRLCEVQSLLIVKHTGVCIDSINSLFLKCNWLGIKLGCLCLCAYVLLQQYWNHYLSLKLLVQHFYL